MCSLLSGLIYPERVSKLMGKKRLKTFSHFKTFNQSKELSRYRLVQDQLQTQLR